ncbi:DegT/DnrJ/EryC1/StrS family aminotransferase [Saccharothrix variisporea]|uniref:DegT/DnrJ/EryC1/StrS aminotransferase family protein n=1 Tax=Saccharothrix variisporea TaxID=543527 RepID=A0A495XJW4_9PSEU|nr:DegT/DnrJ/EryC1/StrS family aminotransferase [Saccharothrix variisporea]RKT74821.1 DegT/DnrJ/EryC1/StrS aminotransferase family protein [Saccharothrix variisporea]
MDHFDTAVVLGRVLTSGVIMSIERNDRELPALERLLCKTSGRPRVTLVNSVTAGLHSALAGLGLGHGDDVAVPALADAHRRFLAWLGVRAHEGGTPAFAHLSAGPDDAGRLGALLATTAGVPAVVLDLTGLGFGPAAAVLFDDEDAWRRAERLKIFGTFDLRTMWTQTEADDGVGGVQFNYRLSPLVAACVRMALTTRGERA